MDSALIAEAVKIAIAAEAQTPKDGAQFQAQQLRQGAVQLDHRPGQGSRRRQPASSSTRATSSPSGAIRPAST